MTPFPRDTPPDAARILESITDAFFALDADWRFTYLNAQAERLLGRTRADLLGRNVWAEFPAAVEAAFYREYHRAVAEQAAVTFEEFYPPPLDTWFQVSAYPSPNGLSVFFQDITERRRVLDALRASEEALRENEMRLKDAQTRLETALWAGGIATWTWDVASDRVVADTNLAPLFSVSPEDAAGGRIGVYLQAIHPEDRARVAEAIQEALADRAVYEAQYRVVLPDGAHRWLATRGRVERDSGGRAISLPGVVLDITERVEREQRERFLADLAERARALADPDEVIADAVRSVGEFLGVSRCLFADIDIEADTCAVPPHYRADASVASIAGVFPISAFGPFVVAEYKAGRTAVVEDVRADPTKAPPGSLAAYEAIGVRAYVAAPVLHSARLVSAIAVHSPVPRRWEAEEIELLQTVVERTWLTVEVTRQNRLLVRVAEEQRARAEREALLSRIGLALRGSPDPERVLETAVRELGVALGADRCYYAAYDQDADTATVGPDWHRDGLASITGQYPMSRFSVNRDPVYQAGRTQVVADTAGDPPTQALGLRALMRVPLVSGASMTALSVAMASEPRQWTPDEVSLVEAVATQTQTTLEAVRVQRREHAIAQQLQDALQPALPERVLGLSVGRFTKPALDEAQIGGDFFDIFALDKELYAILIGDVSGKGLAAAQQLALVRNSLRTTLYLYRAPAQAATALNRIVTAHDLLVGFVTTWVGVYDALTGEIAYCSCGHEPGIIRRGERCDGGDGNHGAATGGSRKCGVRRGDRHPVNGRRAAVVYGRAFRSGTEPP